MLVINFLSSSLYSSSSLLSIEPLLEPPNIRLLGSSRCVIPVDVRSIISVDHPDKSRR